MRRTDVLDRGTEPLDTPKAIQRVQQFADLIRLEMPPFKVVLFGSYARGDFRQDSDIDVAVIVEKVEGDFLKMTARLHALAWPIDYRIEPLLFENDNDPSGLLAYILQNGIVVYDHHMPVSSAA